MLIGTASQHFCKKEQIRIRDGDEWARGIEGVSASYETIRHNIHGYELLGFLSGPYSVFILLIFDTDISMPIMDGMEATREIRKLERAQEKKPAIIIALTGLGSADSQREAFSNGINVFLTKPVRFKDLRKILEEWTPDAAAGGTSNTSGKDRSNRSVAR